MGSYILVPTDFSECAAVAYNYAVLLAEQTKSKICLLHILDIPSPSPSANSKGETRMDTHFMMEMMKLTKARMNKIRASKVFKKVAVEEVIQIGSVPEMIMRAVKKYKADFIVMGTHGTNGLQEKIIGTNAERIVRNVEIPVLSVRNAVKNPKLNTIVFATDFTKESQDVLPMVNDLANKLKARLVLSKVITLNNFETTAQTERAIQLFRDKNKLYSFSTKIYYARNKEEGIIGCADSIGADLIALGTHGRHGLAHFFRGSIAEDVVSHSALPVLTINFKRKAKLGKASGIRETNKKYKSDFLYQIPSV